MSLLLKFMLFSAFFLTLRAIVLPLGRILVEISHETFLKDIKEVLAKGDGITAALTIDEDSKDFPIALLASGKPVVNLDCVKSDKSYKITISNLQIAGFENHRFYSIVEVDAANPDFDLKQHLTGRLQGFQQAFGKSLDFIAKYTSAKQIADQVREMIPKAMDGVAVTEVKLFEDEGVQKTVDPVSGEKSFLSLVFDVGALRRAIQVEINAFSLQFSVKVRFMLDRFEFESHPEQQFDLTKLKEQLDNVAKTYDWELLNKPESLVKEMQTSLPSCKFEVIRSTDFEFVGDDLESLSGDIKAQIERFKDESKRDLFPYTLKATQIENADEQSPCLLDDSFFYLNVFGEEPFHYLHIKYALASKGYALESMLAITPVKDLAARLDDFVQTIHAALLPEKSTSDDPNATDDASDFTLEDLLKLIKENVKAQCDPAPTGDLELNFSVTCSLNKKPVIQINVESNGKVIVLQTLTFLKLREIKKTSKMHLNDQKNIPRKVNEAFRTKLKNDLAAYGAELKKTAL